MHIRRPFQDGIGKYSIDDRTCIRWGRGHANQFYRYVEPPDRRSAFSRYRMRKSCCTGVCVCGLGEEFSAWNTITPPVTETSSTAAMLVTTHLAFTIAM